MTLTDAISEAVPWQEWDDRWPPSRVGTRTGLRGVVGDDTLAQAEGSGWAPSGPPSVVVSIPTARMTTDEAWALYWGVTR